MGTLYTFNPQITGVVRFTDNTGFSVPVTRFLNDASLATLLSPEVYDTRKFIPQYLRSEYVSDTSELPYSPPDVLYKHELPGIKVRNPRFKTRQKKGEIVISRYRRGNILVRCNQRLVRRYELYEGSYILSNWGPLDSRLPKFKVGCELWARKLALNDQPTKSIKGYELKVLYHWDQRRFQGVRYESMAPVFPAEFPASPDPAAVVTEAYASVLQAQMDVLTEIVELPQTMAWIGDKAVKAAVTADKFERRRRRIMWKAVVKKWPPAKLADTLASLELQFRYALMPIVYSVSDAMSLLEQYGYLYKEQRRTVNQSLSRSDAYGEWTGNDKLTAWMKQRFDPDSVMSRMHSLVGPNPITTLWEITPLSFVVDWVVPIGDYLTALTTVNTADEFKASLNHRHSSYCIAKTPSGLYREIYVETYDRTPINPLDHIGLKVNPSMNWKRWLDATSLSWTAARSKLKKLGVRI